MSIDDQIVASFAKLAEGRPEQAADFIKNLREGGVSAFERVFVGRIQSTSPVPSLELPRAPSPPVAPAAPQPTQSDAAHEAERAARYRRRPVLDGSDWAALGIAGPLRHCIGATVRKIFAGTLRPMGNFA
jgi:hypothetical protein